MECGNGVLINVISICLCIILVNGATTNRVTDVSTTHENNSIGTTNANVTSEPSTATSGTIMTASTLNQTVQTTQGPATGSTAEKMSTEQATTTPAPMSSTVSTAKPGPTPKAGRQFDGASFGGGFALASGLVIIAGIIYCCYTRRNKSGYSQY